MVVIALFRESGDNTDAIVLLAAPLNGTGNCVFGSGYDITLDDEGPAGSIQAVCSVPSPQAGTTPPNYKAPLTIRTRSSLSRRFAIHASIAPVPVAVKIMTSPSV